ncbi:transcriptional regulator, TetR family [Micromonospora mirobrigensis]|uniref:Transcriptional regulator, TetR family n=2 Tax=Micromonospora mirobrigensis TaxID=262898 RepID=A0A1C5AKY9_9ACTN|nr:transcriptional regulator, TetR family [Micromonospora mirobrigensis]
MSWHKRPEDQRREQIIAAALRVAARDGLARLTLRKVAAEAGLSHGSLLFHYGSKDLLLEALLDAVLDWLIRPAAPTARRLTDVLREEVSHADPDHTAVLLDFWVVGTRTPALRKRMRTAMESYETRLATLAPDTAAVSPRQLAALANTVVFGAALRRLLGADNHTDAVGALEKLLAAEPTARSD